MALPLHSFEPTGDPLVDDRNFIKNKGEYFPFGDWFKTNAHVLKHTAQEIICDAEPYQSNAGPSGWGIYVLVSNNEIAYVGKTRDIRERLREHQYGGKDFDRYWCIGGIPYDWLRIVEIHYIRRLNPILNMNNIGKGGVTWVEKIADAVP